MKDALSIIKSSFHDIRCCDENPVTEQTTAWRPQMSSVTCVVDGDNKKTGYAHVSTLEEYTVATSLTTGNLKPNVPSQPEFTPDYLSGDCEIDTPPSAPSGGTSIFSSHVTAKGVLDIFRAGVPFDHRAITIPFNYSRNTPADVYSIRVQTFMPDPSTPKPVDIVIGENVYVSNGDITIDTLSSPFAVNIWPAGDGQNHLVMPIE